MHPRGVENPRIYWAGTKILTIRRYTMHMEVSVLDFRSIIESAFRLVSIGIVAAAMSHSIALGAVQGDLLEDETNRIVKSETCYQGEWGSEAAYLARPQTKKAYEDAAQRERAKQRYAIWRERYDCRWIKYPVDDLLVDGFIVVPTGTPPENGWPVVIFNHGGNADIGEVRFQYIAMRLSPLVDAGFAVMGSQYRGTRVSGVENPDRLRDEFGGADVADVLSLIDIAEDLSAIDQDNIGMWGTRRGGMMAFLAARQDDRISALVAEATPVDLIELRERRPDMEQVYKTWIPDYETNPDYALEERSVIYWADELPESTSILILHGSEDQRVDPNQAARLARTLATLRRDFKMVLYEGDAHGIRKNHRAMITEIPAWFARSLMKTH